MRRFILTGTPGSGKTAILRQLELDGFGVVEESATDVIALWQARGIATPWTDPGFIDAIVDLQMQRELVAAKLPDTMQFHDRSVVCTAALATYLGVPFSRSLESALDRVLRERIFEKRVFFVRNLGFVAPTDARRIGLEEALRFEQIHESTYTRFGFELEALHPGSVGERAAHIRKIVESRAA